MTNIVYVKINSDTEDWKGINCINSIFLSELFVYAINLTSFPKKKDIEVSILLTNDLTIKSYNSIYRGKNKATNVLSFPLINSIDDVEQHCEVVLLGDILLSFQTIVKESNELIVPFYNHVMHLIIHGFFHLLGYDHQSDNEANIMEKLEKKCMDYVEIENTNQQQEKDVL
jgi:probable rRNA maturation factor